ncbi:MAG: N-acetylneuraminate synthase [Alphaproteobacteria bacterium]|nr:N-acetylneuraminate synthase [Alphaproteobacteria bacterium]
MEHVYIIAEAGVNHNGSVEIAEKLIDSAAQAGADAVKFQTFIATAGVSRFAEKAQYQKENTTTSESQLEMIKKLELPFDQHRHLMEYCRKRNIQFLSTGFDFESINLLKSLNIPCMKIPSGEITNLPLLRQVNEYMHPVIMSTGMATLNEIKEALAVLKDCKVSLLHCTTEYPCPYEGVNLKAMQTMRDAFHLPVGYSDHTKGIEVPIAAVAMGATIIEKHFTLDRNMEGPDHKASLEPDELKAMVTAIRHIEAALGTGEKEPAECEKKNMAIARKSIVAKRAIKKGELLTEENLTVKRPGDGVSPMKWDEIVGTTAQKDYDEDEKI